MVRSPSATFRKFGMKKGLWVRFIGGLTVTKPHGYKYITGHSQYILDSN